MGLQNRLSQIKHDFCDWMLYKKHYKSLPARIAAMRAKDKIKVLFVLWDLPAWTTEPLFKAMLNHQRFEPVLGLTVNLEDAPTEAIDKYFVLKNYIQQQNYEYVDLTWREMDRIDADLIFYEKPYDDLINNRLWYKCYMHKLFCHCQYAFNSTNKNWGYSLPLQRLSAFNFVENQNVKETAVRTLNWNPSNIRITGLPIMDDLMQAKENLENPWNLPNSNKKRIIWAPHHTIDDTGIFRYSCFLDVCDFMIELAEKYKDKVQFAFKPHPLLKSKLVSLWGEENASAYYQRWATMENTQYECGKFVGLFKHSDAMIHDGGSFTIGYHYTQNPVMYLVNGLPHVEDLNDFAKEAYDCHYFGSTREEIEQFIQNVIDGVDPIKEQRRKYLEENLLPPNGKTACENIIDAILGQNGYE